MQKIISTPKVCVPRSSSISFVPLPTHSPSHRASPPTNHRFFFYPIKNRLMNRKPRKTLTLIPNVRPPSQSPSAAAVLLVPYHLYPTPTSSARPLPSLPHSGPDPPLVLLGYAVVYWVNRFLYASPSVRPSAAYVRGLHSRH